MAYHWEDVEGNDRSIGGANPISINIEIVRRCVASINDSYEHFCGHVFGDFRQDFVVKMADVWRNPNAVKFYNSVKESLERMGLECEQKFAAIEREVDTAARNMVQIQGGHYDSIPFRYDSGMVFDIREINNGGQTLSMDTETAKTVANVALTNLEKNINDDLVKLTFTVKDSGFVGGNIQNALMGRVQEVADEVRRTVSRISTEFYNYVVAEGGNVDNVARASALSFGRGAPAEPHE